MSSIVEPRDLILYTDRYSDQPRDLRCKVFTPEELKIAEKALNPERLKVQPPPPVKREFQPDPKNPLRCLTPKVVPAVKAKTEKRARGRNGGAPRGCTPWNKVKGLTVELILDRLRAGGGIKEIAAEFELTRSAVSHRLHFGLRTAAPELRTAYSALLTCVGCGKPKNPSGEMCASCKRRG